MKQTIRLSSLFGVLVLLAACQSAVDPERPQESGDQPDLTAAPVEDAPVASSLDDSQPQAQPRSQPQAQPRSQPQARPKDDPPIPPRNIEYFTVFYSRLHAKFTLNWHPPSRWGRRGSYTRFEYKVSAGDCDTTSGGTITDSSATHKSGSLHEVVLALPDSAADAVILCVRALNGVQNGRSDSWTARTRNVGAAVATKAASATLGADAGGTKFVRVTSGNWTTGLVDFGTWESYTDDAAQGCQRRVLDHIHLYADATCNVFRSGGGGASLRTDGGEHARIVYSGDDPRGVRISDGPLARGMSDGHSDPGNRPGPCTVVR